MAITVGILKTASDRSNVVTAQVILSSDQEIGNPLKVFSSQEILSSVYSQLNISASVYDIAQLSLSNITSSYYSQYTYQFSVRFAVKGTIPTDPQFIGPAGPPGIKGPQGPAGRSITQLSAGPTGPMGPTGPAGSGSDINERTWNQLIFNAMLLLRSSSGPMGTIEFEDNFSDESTGRFTLLTESTLGSFSIASNQATIDCPDLPKSVIAIESSIFNGPQLYTQITVESLNNISDGVISVGVCKDVDNYIMVKVDVFNLTIGVHTKIGGVLTVVAESPIDSADTPFIIGMSVVKNSVCGYLYRSDSLINSVQADVSSYIDLTGIIYSEWKPAFGFAATANTSILSNFQLGTFASTNIYNPSVVTGHDSLPVLKSSSIQFPNDTVLFTAGCVDDNGEVYSALFEYNLRLHQAYQKTIIMIERDGGTFTDYVPCMIKTSDNKYEVFMPTSTGYIYRSEVSSTTFDTLVRYNMSSPSALSLTNTSMYPGQYWVSVLFYDGYYYCSYPGTISLNEYAVIDRSANLSTWANVTSIGPLSDSSGILTYHPGTNMWYTIINTSVYIYDVQYNVLLDVVDTWSTGRNNTTAFVVNNLWYALSSKITNDSIVVRMSSRY